MTENDFDNRAGTEGQETERPGRQERPQRRRPRYQRYRQRPKVCAFCVEHVDHIDYKNVNMLRRYLTDRGKIRPRRQTGTCAKHQRRLSVAIKRARHLALLPFAAEHLRHHG